MPRVYRRAMSNIVILACIGVASARGWTPDTLPKPAGRISDPDNLVQNPEQLEQLLADVAATDVAWPAASPCTDGGAEVVVVVVDSLGVHRWADDDAVDAAAKTLARGAHDAWGVGDACSNGAVVLFAIQDRSFYLSTGAGLRDGGLVGDRRAEKALAAAKPALRRGDVDGGVRAAVDALSGFLAAGPPTWTERLADNAGAILVVLIFGSAFAWSVYQTYEERRRREDYAAATRQLQVVEDLRDGSGAFAAESCPVCLEDFGPDRRARGLGCGHGFCQPCLDRWLESNNTCPVCRAPTSSAAVPARPPDAMDEVRFRLDRIQRRYPSVLERRVLDGIVRRGFRGPLARDPAVVSRRPPPPRPPSSSSSSSYGGSAFGGGRSSGGAGGRW